MNRVYCEELRLFCETVDLSKLATKRIMINGATGLIGSYLVDIIMCSNYIFNMQTHVYAIVRNSNAATIRFKRYLDDPFFNIVVHDVSMPIKYNFNVDYIIHAASNATPHAFDIDPIGIINANVNGTLNSLRYASQCNAKKLLFLSSSEVYGEPIEKDTIHDENSMGIVYPLKSRSSYTESKRMAENICVNYYNQYGVPNSIARICFAYGPTYTPSDDRVIPQFFRNALKKENIILKSTGELVRSYAYLFDVASGLFKILFEGNNAEAYNIANRHSNVSIREIAQTIADIAGVDLTFDVPNSSDRKGYSPFSSALIDPSKLEKLSWKPMYNLRDGIHQIVKILCAKENIN